MTFIWCVMARLCCKLNAVTGGAVGEYLRLCCKLNGVTGGAVGEYL